MEKIFNLIREAGQIALFEQKQLHTKTKPDGSIVTNGDLKVSHFLETSFKNLYPDFDVYSEENCGKLPQSNKAIVIDPIDGTLSYAKKLDTWSLLVAFVEGPETKSGFVYQPTLDKMFYAVKLQGAFFSENGLPFQPMKAEGTGELKGTKSFKNMGESEFLHSFQIHKIDEMYSAALKIMKVALGECDLYPNFQKGCSIWDLLAPQLILKESGGSLIFENEVSWDYQNPKLAEKFCAFGSRISKYDLSRWS